MNYQFKEKTNLLTGPAPSCTALGDTLSDAGGLSDNAAATRAEARAVALLTQYGEDPAAPGRRVVTAYDSIYVWLF
jgi:hypothetical protein